MHNAKCCPVVSLGSLQNVVQWNELITSYVNNNLYEKAMASFEQMKAEGVITPDSITFTCVLKACGIVGSLEIGEEVYEEIRKRGLLQKDVVLGNSLVDMYCKCGTLEKAQHVFDQLPVRNVGSWNALIAGFAQQGQCHEAIDCFERIQNRGVTPNSITFICLLKSCSKTGDIKNGT